MSDQGETYTSFIGEQLRAELERKERLETRGIGVVSTTSGLVALSLALAGVLLGEDIHASGWAAVVLILAAVCLLGAGTSGILTSYLMPYQVADIPTLSTMLSAPRWWDTEVSARNACAALNLETITSLRRINRTKADLLTLALIFQVLSIIGLYVGFLLSYRQS